MKRIFFYLTVAVAMSVAAVAMSSCEKTPTYVDAATLSMDVPAEIVFNSDGTGSVDVINVTTNQPDWDFTLMPADGWLSASRNGNALSLTAEPNTSPETPENVTIRITAGYAAPVEVVARQLPASPALAVTPSVTGVVFSAEGIATFQGISEPTARPVFTVTTNVAEGWNVESGADAGWLTVEPAGNTFTISASVNRDGARNTQLRVMAGEAAPVVIDVRQEGHVASNETSFMTEGLTGEITITYTDGEQATLTLSGNSATIQYGESSEKTIYSISSDAIGEILIGRETGGNIKLKFENNALVLRDAVDGKIPIGSYAEFSMIGSNDNALAGDYIQEADLDLLGSEDLTSNGLVRHQWTPIGTFDYGFIPSVGTTKFIGNFDGKGFTVSNIYIDMMDLNYMAPKLTLGLFGYISGNATLSNIHIVSGSIVGNFWVGAVCGYADSADNVISNCSNAANVWGVQRSAGISAESYGTIKSCYNTGGIMTGHEYNGGYAGGIVANNLGKVELCYNTADLTGHNPADMVNMGGICGYNTDLGEISACYNTGDLQEFGNFAGYVGGISGDSYGRIIQCYNTGDITGKASDGNLGGITGWNSSDGTNHALIKGCYSTGVISGTSAKQGGISGGNHGFVEASYWLGTGKGISDDWNTVKQESNCISFSASAWPGVGTAPGGGSWADAGWSTGSGGGNNWKSLGSWVAGGSPEGVNSTFPSLYWE